MVTWSTWIPRSVSRSSTSRYDSAKRRYQRTASTMMSGGKQKPAKADEAIGAGPGRRVVMATVCVPWLGHSRCNSAEPLGIQLAEERIGSRGKAMELAGGGLVG